MIDNEILMQNCGTNILDYKGLWVVGFIQDANESNSFIYTMYYSLLKKVYILQEELHTFRITTF